MRYNNKKSSNEIHQKTQSAYFTYDAALYLDFYGGLLTEKQSEILDSYYNEDYSLSEIAKGLNISRQAAHDAIRIGTQVLLEYEKKLNLVETYKKELRDAGEAREAITNLRAVVSELHATTSFAREQSIGSAIGEAVNEKPVIYGIACGEAVTERSVKYSGASTASDHSEIERCFEHLDAAISRIELSIQNWTNWSIT